MERGETIEFEHPIRHQERAPCARSTAGACRFTSTAWCAASAAWSATSPTNAARSRTRRAKPTRIAELYRIAAAAGIAQDERVAQRARRGDARTRRSDWAYVGRLDGGVVEMIFTAGESPGAFPVGTTIEIARAVIRHALETQDIFFAEDLGEPEYGEDLAGARSVWRSFVGIPLVLDGEQYGAVGFTTSLRIMHLSATDRDYIRALAALIGSAVQQSQREKRLDSLAFDDSLTGLPNRALLARPARTDAALGATSLPVVRHALHRHRSLQVDQRHVRSPGRRQRVDRDVPPGCARCCATATRSRGSVAMSS